ncbi:MAG TPA: hypothetical protein VGE67_06230 [Haloferula sp.]
MSSYSSICLVANKGFSRPSAEELRKLFTETCMLDPERADRRFGNLTPEFRQHFGHRPERSQNDAFFRPETISGRDRIEIHDIDGDYSGAGYTISISGPGYFWPLATNDLWQIVNHPKLRQLAFEVASRFKGEFVPPRFRGKRILNKTLIEGSGPWFWFGSQSL